MTTDQRAVVHARTLIRDRRQLLGDASPQQLRGQRGVVPGANTADLFQICVQQSQRINLGALHCHQLRASQRRFFIQRVDVEQLNRVTVGKHEFTGRPRRLQRADDARTNHSVHTNALRRDPRGQFF